MKILILLFFSASWAYAQNIDRARLHQEMDALSDTQASVVDEIVKEKPSKEINFAEDNLEKDYFKDKVRSKKAAPKRLK